MSLNPKSNQKSGEVTVNWAHNYFSSSATKSGEAETHWAVFCNRCGFADSGSLSGKKAEKFKSKDVFSKIESHKNKKHKNLTLTISADPSLARKFIR